jgi:hypothetical protein
MFWRQTMFKKILLAGLMGATFATVPIASFAQHRTVIITQPPPPPRSERVPTLRHGYEWAPGHWVWRHGQHVWVAGHQMRERRGSHWVPDRWVERNGHWTMIAGHWQRSPRAHRDRDGDGVPNRFDSRPNNPNRS